MILSIRFVEACTINANDLCYQCGLSFFFILFPKMLKNMLAELEGKFLGDSQSLPFYHKSILEPNSLSMSGQPTAHRTFPLSVWPVVLFLWNVTPRSPTVPHLSSCFSLSPCLWALLNCCSHLLFHLLFHWHHPLFLLYWTNA